MTVESNEPVLVVGAGPVGLSTALGLIDNGVPVRIIERAEEVTDLSKALVVWARTLEVLNGHVDARRFVDEGIAIAGARLHRDDRLIGELDLQDVDSVYHAGVLLPQSETERLLIARLAEQGVEVERGTELIGIENASDHVTFRVRGADGEEKSGRTPWLIGCDGAHSLVRDELGLDFDGGENPDRFVLGDVHVDAALPGDMVSAYFHKDGLMAFFPIKGGRHRMIANTIDSGPGQADPTLDELQSIASARFPEPISLSEPDWIGAFRIRERVLDSYRKGRCFLAGDAAHVHSPVGGQGMNTGIQDAMNLVWKIAFHERGLGSEALLDSYSEERSEIGRKVVARTTRATGIATTRNPVLRFARNTVMHVGLGLPLVQNMLSHFLSMIEVNYRDARISGADAVHRRHHDLRSGDRLPCLPLERAGGSLTHLESACSATRFTVVVVENPETPEFAAAVESILHNIPEVLEPFTDVVVVHCGSGEPPATPDGVACLRDREGTLRTSAGFNGHGAFLVRPDRYIALFFGAVDTEPLRSWAESL